MGGVIPLRLASAASRSQLKDAGTISVMDLANLKPS
jgi:hypothetical protein